MIDILVPVLGRPQNAKPLAESIAAATTAAYRLLFLATEGDEESIEACRLTGAEVLEVPGGRSEYPRKMNVGFGVTSNPFLLLAADDISFTPGWDALVVRKATRARAGVVGTNDLCNRLVMRGLWSTHPLVSRYYIEEYGGSLDGPGVLLHEGYDHNYCDRELCHLAQSRGRWAFVRNAELKHQHPMRGGAAYDATYKKGQANAIADHRLFIIRSKQWRSVGLVPEEKAAIRAAERRDLREARKRGFRS